MIPSRYCESKHCLNLQGERCFLTGNFVDGDRVKRCKVKKYFLIRKDGSRMTESNNPVIRLMHNVIKF